MAQGQNSSDSVSMSDALAAAFDRIQNHPHVLGVAVLDPLYEKPSLLTGTE